MSQAGNTNASKSKRIFNSALKRVLTQNPEKVEKVVNKLIKDAEAGEQWAIKELIDRVDGRPPQAIIGGDEDDAPIQILGRVKLVKPGD